jgi:hypothetical protein
MRRDCIVSENSRDCIVSENTGANFTSDALHVVERYTLAGPNTLLYEATIEDPKVFTRPWKMSFPLYRRLEKNAQVLEFRCVPFTEEYLYGSLAKKGSFVKKGS